MASIPTIKELRAMQAKDLQGEIADHARSLAKIRLDVAAGGEKDTAKLRRLRKADCECRCAGAISCGMTSCTPA